MSQAALQYFFDKSDAKFFFDHPDRRTHIRKAFQNENEREFSALGEHEVNRRMVVLWKVPRDSPFRGANGKDPTQLLKIPFLKFADESIEDDDKVLLPLIHQVMEDALKTYARESQQG